MKYFFYFLFLIQFVACKTENPSTTEGIKKLAEAKAVNPKDLTIPSVDKMISQEQLQEIFGLSKPVNVRVADDPSNPNSRAAFFQWDDDDTPNAGILLQVQTNPVFDEFEDYVSSFVKAKFTEGETTLGSDKPSLFKKFKAGSVEGAYSFEQSRFYWNYGKNYLVMLAMNFTTMSESDMVKKAEDIAAKVNENFVANVDFGKIKK